MEQIQSHCASQLFRLHQAWRKYTAKLAEFIWIGYIELEKITKSDYGKNKQAILNLYWWLQLVMAREEGQLPAWEGIRIVQERNLF